MGILDKNVVMKHLKEMEISLKYLRGKKGVTEKDILANLEERFAIERALHLAIQNLIDAGGHILASKNINDIETYADIPLKLKEAKIISETLAANLIKMAKFRNILVHEYVKIESAKLLTILRNNLDDFEKFAAAVSKHLKTAD